MGDNILFTSHSREDVVNKLSKYLEDCKWQMTLEKGVYNKDSTLIQVYSTIIQGITQVLEPLKSFNASVLQEDIQDVSQRFLTYQTTLQRSLGTKFPKYQFILMNYGGYLTSLSAWFEGNRDSFDSTDGVVRDDASSGEHDVWKALGRFSDAVSSMDTRVNERLNTLEDRVNAITHVISAEH